MHHIFWIALLLHGLLQRLDAEPLLSTGCMLLMSWKKPILEPALILCVGYGIWGFQDNVLLWLRRGCWFIFLLAWVSEVSVRLHEGQASIVLH